MRDQRAAATPQALVMLAEVRAVMLRLAVAVAEAAAEALAAPLPEAEVETEVLIEVHVDADPLAALVYLCSLSFAKRAQRSVTEALGVDAGRKPARGVGCDACRH